MDLSLEIYGYRQLCKVRPEFVSALEEAVVRVQKIFLIEPSFSRGGFRTWDLTKLQIKTGLVWDFCLALRHVLFEHNQDIPGYDLFMTTEEEKLKSNDLWLCTREMSMHFSRSSDLYCTPAIVREYSEFIDFEEVGNIFVFARMRDLGIKLEGTEPVWFSATLTDSLKAELAGPNALKGERGYKILHLCGLDAGGAINHLEDCLSEYYPGTNPPLVVLRQNATGDNYLSIFEYGVDIGFLEKCHEYLDSMTQKALDDVRPVLGRKAAKQSVYSDHPFEDIYLGFILYFSAFCEKMKRENKPAVLCFYLPDLMPPRTQKLLAKVIEEFSDLPNFFPVVMTFSNTLPDVFSAFTFVTLQTGSVMENTVQAFSSEWWKVWFETTRTGAKQLEITGASDLNSLVVSLGHKPLLILFFIILSDGFNTPDLIRDFCKSFELSPTELDRIKDHLLSLGLIRHGNGSSLVAQNGLETQEALEKIKVLIGNSVSIVHDFFAKLWEHKAFPAPVKVYFRIVRITGSDMGALFPFYNFMDQLLCEKQYQTIETYLASVTSLFPMPGPLLQFRYQLDILLSVVRLRLALAQHDEEKVIAAYRVLAKSGVMENPLLGELLQYRALYHWTSNEKHSAISYAKKALMYYQDVGNEAGIASSNCQLGIAMLSDQKLSDAMAYFGMAREGAVECGSWYVSVKAAYHESVCHIISGNLTMAKKLISQYIGLSCAKGMRDAQSLLLFLAGRIHFMLGHPDKAMDLFLKVQSLIKVYSQQEASATTSAWIGRMMAYQGHYQAAHKRLTELADCPQKLWFLAELALLQGQEEEALSLLEQPESVWERSSFPGTFETIDWQSGFAFCEDMGFPREDGKGTLHNLKHALRGYLKVSAGREDGLEELESVTRDQSQVIKDAHRIFYNYLYSLAIVKIKGAKEADRVPYLSKALKMLQERAARNEDRNDKTDYVLKNFWNAKVFEEAKLFNLV